MMAIHQQRHRFADESSVISAITMEGDDDTTDFGDDYSSLHSTYTLFFNTDPPKPLKSPTEHRLEAEELTLDDLVIEDRFGSSSRNMPQERQYKSMPQQRQYCYQSASEPIQQSHNRYYEQDSFEDEEDDVSQASLFTLEGSYSAYEDAVEMLLDDDDELTPPYEQVPPSNQQVTPVIKNRKRPTPREGLSHRRNHHGSSRCASRSIASSTSATEADTINSPIPTRRTKASNSRCQSIASASAMTEDDTINSTTYTVGGGSAAPSMELFDVMEDR